jgi:hypothetical protein
MEGTGELQFNKDLSGIAGLLRRFPFHIISLLAPDVDGFFYGFPFRKELSLTGPSRGFLHLPLFVCLAYVLSKLHGWLPVFSSTITGVARFYLLSEE